MRSVYIVGEPGAGKSTLMRALTAGVARLRRAKPFAHDLLVNEETGRPVGIEIGAAHPTFPGTDRLSMSVQPRAIEWVQGEPTPLLLGEGDRLATRGFLGALAGCSTQLSVVWLDVPEEVAAARRAARGTKQSETWVIGRRTKVARLVAELRGWADTGAVELLRLDASLPTDVLADGCRQAIPALSALAR